MTDLTTATPSTRSSRFHWGDAVTALLAACCAALTWAIVRDRPPNSAAVEPFAPGPGIAQSLQGAPTKGNLSAPVAIIEYTDFACFYCRKFAASSLKVLEERYIASGTIVLAFRYLPLQDTGGGMVAAQAAGCAGQQGRFWDMHDNLFREIGSPRDRNGMLDQAQNLGLQMPSFRACLNGPTVPAISEDMRMADTLSISATPTFLIGRNDGHGHATIVKRILGNVQFSDFVEAIALALANKH
jgi:protein-disulfide isomerase